MGVIKLKFIDLALSKCNFRRKTLFLAKDKMTVIALSSSILFLKTIFKVGFKVILRMVLRVFSKTK